MSKGAGTTSPRMTTLSLHSSLSPTPRATTRSPLDVNKTMRSAPSMQICVPSSPEGYAAKSEVSWTSLFPFTTWSWDQVGQRRCARSLRVGVPKDPIYTVVFTPVYRTGFGPEYCCLEKTFAPLSAKLDTPVSPKCISMKLPRLGCLSSNSDANVCRSPNRCVIILHTNGAAGLQSIQRVSGLLSVSLVSRQARFVPLGKCSCMC